jgi:anaerobic magnesium-protoporphyrin IX monomethyl ester cyclase
VFTDHLSAEQLVILRDMVERDVRKALNIPFNAGAPALRYEHSMGQGLPDFIHRIGKEVSAATSAEANVPVRAVAG